MGGRRILILLTDGPAGLAADELGCALARRGDRVELITLGTKKGDDGASQRRRTDDPDLLRRVLVRRPKDEWAQVRAIAEGRWFARMTFLLPPSPGLADHVASRSPDVLVLDAAAPGAEAWIAAARAAGTRTARPELESVDAALGAPWPDRHIHPASAESFLSRLAAAVIRHERRRALRERQRRRRRERVRRTLRGAGRLLRRLRRG